MNTAGALILGTFVAILAQRQPSAKSSFRRTQAQIIGLEPAVPRLPPNQTIDNHARCSRSVGCQFTCMLPSSLRTTRRRT